MQVQQQPPRQFSKFITAQQKINTVFGVLDVAADDVFPATLDIEDTFGLRESGLAKEMVKTKSHFEALNDPKTYLMNKADDLKAIGIAVGKEYKYTYAKAFIKGLSETESEKHARDAMMSMKKIKMIDHEMSFPTEYTSKSWNKIEK